MKLNKIERLKHSLPPFEFDISRVDFNNLSESDRFYLKNFGIYNSKLRPKDFFIRVRVAAGKIGKEKISFILNLAKEFDIKLITTARAQIELHNLNSNNVYLIYKLLQENGITTHQTLTDNFRNIVTTPFDGKSKDNRIFCYPIILEMQNIILDNPKFFGMIPRKFNSAICGDEFSSFGYFGNDLYFGLAKKGERLGFNLYVGGKNSVGAKDINIFVEPKDVARLFEIVANIYLQKGPRENRAKSRFFFLVEAIGVDGLRELIKREFKELEEKGEYLVKKEPFRREKDNIFCYETKYGDVEIEELEKIINLATDIWFGVDQNIYYEGKRVKAVENRASLEITACAGRRYCPLSLWDIKSDTSYLPIELIKKHNITIGFSGCLKGCGRHHFADIGLVGLRTNIYGKTAKAARLFLGGVYSKEQAKAARLIFYAIPLEHLSSTITLIIEEFLRYGYEDFEEFSINILNRYSEGFLMVWFLSKIYLGHNLLLDKDEKELFKELQDLPDFPQGQEYIEIVDFLKHKVWDYKDL